MNRLIPLFFIILISCKKESLDCVNSNTVEGQLFECSYLIEIPPYIYLDNFITGDTAVPVEIFGDSLYDHLLAPESADVPVPRNRYDNFTQHFEIQWTSTEIEELIMGIFINPVITSPDPPRQILNLEDMIWTWNTSMSADDGVVSYNDGSTVSVSADGTITYLPLTLLDIGSTYYLGMWGYNDEATTVIYSSRQIEMKIFN